MRKQPESGQGDAVKLRCAACRRPLLKPAYIAPAGYVLGPKCAERAGKLELKRNRVARLALVVEVQDGQLGLFAAEHQN